MAGAARRIGIRELKEHTSKILREARENREILEVTNRGELIARIVPAPRPPTPEEKQAWAEWRLRMSETAERIGRNWPKGVSAVDAIREDRGRLD